jgi:hypothetical protein
MKQLPELFASICRSSYHRKIAGASERNYRKVEKELDVEIEDLERETRKEG